MTTSDVADKDASDKKPLDRKIGTSAWGDILRARDEVSQLLTSQREFLINVCAPIFGILGLIQFAALELLVTNIPMATRIVSISVILILFASPLIYKKSSSFRPISIIINLSIGLSLYISVWTDEGILSPLIILLVQLPILVTFMTGIRSGLYTLAGVAIAMIALVVRVSLVPDVPQEILNQSILTGLITILASVTAFLLVGLIWHAVVMTLRTLGELTNELEVSNRTKTVFLTQMSHELRTPLNGILGFSSLIRKKTENYPPEDRVEEFAGHIYNSGEHLLNLVNELLNFTQLMSSEITLNRELLLPRDLVTFTTDAVAPLSSAKGQTFTFDPRTETSTAIVGDGTKLRQIMLNLVGNAIKYADDSSVIAIDLNRNDKDQIEVRVTNQGTTMTPEEIQVAFEPFGRVGENGKPGAKEEGLGLGLPIARRIAVAHGGSLDLVSVEGEGTTAILALPCDTAPEEDYTPKPLAQLKF